MNNKIVIIIFLMIVNLICIFGNQFKYINAILESINKSVERTNQRYTSIMDEIKNMRKMLVIKKDNSNKKLLKEKEKELKKNYNYFIKSSIDYKQIINKLDKKYFEQAFKEIKNNDEFKEIEDKLNEAQNKFIALSKEGKINEEYHKAYRSQKEIFDHYNQLKTQLMTTIYSKHSSKEGIIEYFKKENNYYNKLSEFNSLLREIKDLLIKFNNELREN